MTDVEGKFVRQSGGKGQYGHVVLKIEPQEPGKASSSSTPSRAAWCRASSSRRSEGPGGHAAQRRAGRLSGGRRQGHAHLRLVPRGGLERKNAFKMAASIGFRTAAARPAGDPGADDGRRGGDAGRLRRQRDGRPVVPSRHGAGHGRHARRRQDHPAEVPLSEMFGYPPRCARCRQGRATYTMEFKHYAEAPKNVADAIITARAEIT